MVVAHLAAYRTPQLDEGFLRQLRTTGPRTVDCAVSQAVDEAVSSRSASLQPWLPGDGLAGHCVDVLRQLIADEGPEDPCIGDEFAYVSTLDQWVAIKSLIEEHPPDEPRDPRTEEWERRTGRLIPGETRLEQRDAVIAFRDLAHADGVARDLVTFGARRPSALEQAIGSAVTHALWTRQVEQAVAAFPNVRWIRDYFSLSTPPSREGATDG